MSNDYPAAYGALAGSVMMFLCDCLDRRGLERKLFLCNLVAEGRITYRESMRRFYVLDSPALARQFEDR